MDIQATIVRCGVEERVVTAVELAAHLGVVVSTIDRLRRQGLPVAGVFDRRGTGRKPMAYRVSEVEAWIAEQGGGPGTREVAAEFGVALATVYKWIKEGVPRGRRIASLRRAGYRFDLVRVREWLAAREASRSGQKPGPKPGPKLGRKSLGGPVSSQVEERCREIMRKRRQRRRVEVSRPASPSVGTLCQRCGDAARGMYCDHCKDAIEHLGGVPSSEIMGEAEGSTGELGWRTSRCDVVCGERPHTDVLSMRQRKDAQQKAWWR